MKFLFEDESFSFETLRAAGFANYAGAELGEVVVTANAITDGDEVSWLAAWQTTADRVAELGESSLARGHHFSARDAFLRASNYYRTAEFFKRQSPAGDPDVLRLSGRSRETFMKAGKLFGGLFERIAIPYEGTQLPGYFFVAQGASGPRPTIIYNNGFDSTSEEAWFVIAAAALERGYNVIAFDGPGQGAAIRDQNLCFRHDWEAVIGPVIDYALTRQEVAPDKVILFGYSLGAFLVARAAAFDHRVAALILDDGIYDFHSAFKLALPPFLSKWIDDGQDAFATPVLHMLSALRTGVRWALNNGMWTFGAKSMPEFVRLTKKYTLAGAAELIKAPTLVLDAENDQFLKGQPDMVNAALQAPRQLIRLTSAEGAGEHCHMGAMTRMHQVIFDWLGDTLG